MYLNYIFFSCSNTTSKGYVGGFGEILKEYNSLYHPLAHQGSAVDVGYFDPIYDLTASLVIDNHCWLEARTIKHKLQKLEPAAYAGLNLKNNSNMIVKSAP